MHAHIPESCKEMYILRVLLIHNIYIYMYMMYI